MNHPNFHHIKKGDIVTRLLGGTVPMRLIVTEVGPKYIYCGDWVFSRENGAEIDDDLGWNEEGTGSYLIQDES